MGGAAAFAAAQFTTAFAADDTPALAATKKWFKEAQFGMMAHFGLYTLAGGEWKGRKGAHVYGEWLQHSESIPVKEYSLLARAFNPVMFDPLDWMKRARDAGMKYFVITSKHHDGFALYRSRVSKYNVVDATPFKRDVIGEVAEACRATGIKLGLYYSQDVDWSDPDGGGRLVFGNWPYGRRAWGNDWDWKDASGYDFKRYLQRKSLPQMKEILTQYGDLCLIWFDVPVTMSRAESQEFVDLVRKHQPGCLVSGRIGNGLGDYETPGDNAIASKTEEGRLYETVGTMNDSWGYRPTDTHYRTVADIEAIREKCRSIGSNYMLNVGPDPLGRFPVAAVDILNGLANNRKG
ncbi:MAG: alpha-L-fucosidase [Kiritimatiellae bacterium]|nr:alpha-L-fucosidase [Kiritimatiellia bacterium]